MKSERTHHPNSLDKSLRNVVVALRRTQVGHGARWLFYCALVGLVAGAAALGFDVLSSASVHLFLEKMAGWSPVRPAGEHSLFEFVGGERNLWLLALVPALGGRLQALLETARSRRRT